MSFPYCVGQVPVHYNEYATGRPHVEGKDKDRFRSKYLDIPERTVVSVRLRAELYDIYCFGSFSDKDSMKDGESIRATGNRKKYRHLKARNRNHPVVSP